MKKNCANTWLHRGLKVRQGGKKKTETALSNVGLQKNVASLLKESNRVYRVYSILYVSDCCCVYVFVLVSLQLPPCVSRVKNSGFVLFSVFSLCISRVRKTRCILLLYRYDIPVLQVFPSSRIVEDYPVPDEWLWNIFHSIFYLVIHRTVKIP